MSLQINKKKPLWLNKKVNLSDCRKIKKLLRGRNLHTVCEESMCPNISECFNCGVATFMILGNRCTRNCSFCTVGSAIPLPVDYDEPLRIKKAVKDMSLNYVVVTSVTRDDLPDGGSSIFAATVKEIKSLDESIRVEILIPDFLGDPKSLGIVAKSGADVIAHNMETVLSIYRKVRHQADYQRSLNVLKVIKGINKDILTKSGIMLGLGETDKELKDIFRDLAEVNCDILTIGQYLSPSLKHYPVQEYITPEKFLELEKAALCFGFKVVKSSPYMRSSYLAHTIFD